MSTSCPCAMCRVARTTLVSVPPARSAALSALARREGAWLKMDWCRNRPEANAFQRHTRQSRSSSARLPSSPSPPRSAAPGSCSSASTHAQCSSSSRGRSKADTLRSSIGCSRESAARATRRSTALRRSTDCSSESGSRSADGHGTKGCSHIRTWPGEMSRAATKPRPDPGICRTAIGPTTRGGCSGHTQSASAVLTSAAAVSRGGGGTTT
mmetsp:Transcript_10918/g.34561  ORF Transcript_10918/g.34561 Transcript_10918/m.34561 type:complete len:211 (+) Transcript_10918:804-1436(+)